LANFVAALKVSPGESLKKVERYCKAVEEVLLLSLEARHSNLWNSSLMV
jgi:hypothetical protein